MMHRRNHGRKSGGTKRDPKGRSSKPEGLRAGVGCLGRGQRAPSPPARGSGERCKLPSGVRGGAQKKWILVYFGTKFCRFSRLKWSKSWGTNNIGVPRTVISGGRVPRGVYAYGMMYILTTF